MAAQNTPSLPPVPEPDVHDALSSAVFPEAYSIEALRAYATPIAAERDRLRNENAELVMAHQYLIDHADSSDSACMGSITTVFVRDVCQKALDASPEAVNLIAVRDRLRDEVETLRMQLVGCGVCAMENTADSVAKRIKRDSPYWSASYGDVCRAVDEEIRLRTLNTELAQALQKLTLMARTSGGTAGADPGLMLACTIAEGALAKVKP